MRRAVFVAVAGIVVSACGTKHRPAATVPAAPAAPAPAVAPAATAVAAEPKPSPAADASKKLTALLSEVKLRLADNPATRDLRKAQQLLESAEQLSATAAVPLPVSDLLQLLREAADLRAQLRAARADVKSLEAEIAKKDDALRRVTSAVVGGKAPDEQ